MDARLFLLYERVSTMEVQYSVYRDSKENYEINDNC